MTVNCRPGPCSAHFINGACCEWQHQTAATKGQLKAARESPYKVGQRKVWYMLPNTTCRALKKEYLVALLSAQPATPVPHLASMKVYKQLLNPEWKPNKKQRLGVVMPEGLEEWDWEPPERPVEANAKLFIDARLLTPTAAEVPAPLAAAAHRTPQAAAAHLQERSFRVRVLVPTTPVPWCVFWTRFC